MQREVDLLMSSPDETLAELFDASNAMAALRKTAGAITRDVDPLTEPAYRSGPHAAQQLLDAHDHAVDQWQRALSQHMSMPAVPETNLMVETVSDIVSYAARAQSAWESSARAADELEQFFLQNATARSRLTDYLALEPVFYQNASQPALPEYDILARSVGDISTSIDRIQSAFEASVVPLNGVDQLRLSIANGMRDAVIPDFAFIRSAAEIATEAASACERLMLGLASTGDELARRMSGIREPWLFASAAGTSVFAFAELTGFANLASEDEPFGPRASAEFLHQLGQPVDYDELAVPEVRERRRDRAGRNPTLINFPHAAYPGVVSAAGLSFKIPPAPTPVPESGVATHYASEHGEILTHLEQHLRQLVACKLQLAAGSNWIKQRVPQQVRSRWLERQAESREKLEPVYALEQYADFGDLAEIMTGNSNWIEFKDIFRTKQNVQVSFSRLQPIRRHIAHSRPLTKGEILELMSESMRIFRALGLEV